MTHTTGTRRTSRPPSSRRRRRSAVRRLALGLALALAAPAATASATTAARGETAPPPQAPVAARQAPYSPATTAGHTVTWDADSLKIDGKRLNIWSGEFHY
ncbi:hypothetical protein [Streptomyces sp. NPDC000994]